MSKVTLEWNKLIGKKDGLKKMEYAMFATNLIKLLTVFMFVSITAPIYAFKQEGPKLESVLFDTNSSDIKGSELEKLERAATLIKEKNLKVILVGNTDERGDRAYNIDLGAKRSTAVSNKLIDLGVESSHIMFLSYGEESPAAPHGTRAHLATNRRVDIITISPDKVKSPYKNRVSFHLGGAPQGLEDVEVTGRRAKFEQNYEPIVGLGYQRLVTNRVSIGANFFSNLSGTINLGLDF